MPQSKQAFLGTGEFSLRWGNKTCFVRGRVKPPTIIKDAEANLRTPATTRRVYRMFSRNASKRSQVFAPVATRCNFREIGSVFSFDNSVLIWLSPGRSMVQNLLVMRFR